MRVLVQQHEKDIVNIVNVAEGGGNMCSFGFRQGGPLVQRPPARRLADDVVEDTLSLGSRTHLG